MQITSVEVRKMENSESKMKGKATVVIDNCFKIRDIRIIERGPNDLIVVMPSRKKTDGEHYDVAHPLNQETRKMFEDAIFEKYNEVEPE